MSGVGSIGGLRDEPPARLSVASSSKQVCKRFLVVTPSDMRYGKRGPGMATIRQAATVALVSVILLLSSVPAKAAIDTTTLGKVCGHLCPQRHLSTFGGYVFKGGTWPSQAGQTIRFDYRKRGRQSWNRFGRYNPTGTRKAFRILRKGPPTDRLNRDHRFRIWFSPYKTGRWVVRARFVQQDGYAASSRRVRVRVTYSD